MIYLDNAATSFPKPEPVYQALDRFARTTLANPGRAGHRMAVAAERALDATRHALNQFFGGAGPERWVFTLNGTDALNLAIKGTVQAGDHVVTTDLEHNSVSRPLVALERAGVITLSRVCSLDGYIEPAAIKAAMNARTSLVALTHASNVLGTVQPIEAIAPLVREAGALLLVDAAQSAGVVPIDLRVTPIDLLAFPGHKALYGPTGTGALYVGRRCDGKIRPWREAAILRAPLNRQRSLIFSKGARPMCSASPGWPRGSPGWPGAGPTISAGMRSVCCRRLSTGLVSPMAGRSPAAGSPKPMWGHFRSFRRPAWLPRTWGRFSTPVSTSRSVPACTVRPISIVPSALFPTELCG
jgi:hypothetical protein